MECGMWNVKEANEESGMRNVECEMWRAKREMWDVECGKLPKNYAR